jgi:hypothetical protein
MQTGEDGDEGGEVGVEEKGKEVDDRKERDSDRFEG